MSSNPPQLLATNSPLRIDDVGVRQDSYGRYCLNDLHRAAGGEKRHQPSDFLRLDTTSELVKEIHSGDSRSAPVEVINGGPARGTYVCRELVYAYAMWVSPVFHLKVIRTFDAVTTGAIRAPVQMSRRELLRIALEQEEQLEAQQKQLAEQQRQLSAQEPAVEFVEKYVEAKSTQCIRDVAKVLGLGERAFISRLQQDGVLFRQSGRLRPYAMYVEKGYFEVKTGAANSGHAFIQPRLTPAGIAWAARRYGQSAADPTHAGEG